MLVVLLSLLASASGLCQWGQIFKDSSLLCSIGGSKVQCSGLPDSDSIVKIACSAGMVVAGYKQYSCNDGEIVPRQLASECVSIETDTCREPFGEQQANMKFVTDSEHVYDRLPISANSDLAFNVECAEGYKFSAQAPSTVVAQCVAMEKGKSRFHITTQRAQQGCLPACQVRDKDNLPKNIPNLDRVTIVYPSDKKQVGNGALLYAKVHCSTGFSAINKRGDTVPLTCSTEGVAHANSGYFMQTCEEGLTCLSCAKNCGVPAIEGSVWVGNKESDEGLMAIPTGRRTARVMCQAGLSVMGNRFLDCDNGALNSTIPSCVSDVICEPVYVANGIALPDLSTTTSTKYEVECSPGFSLAKNADKKVMCSIEENTSGAEYSETPICHLGCDVPSITDGVLVESQEISSDNAAPYSPGATVSFTCTDDLILMGTPTATCGVLGWENLPQCVVEGETGKTIGGSGSGATSLASSIGLILSLLFLLV